MTIGLPRAAVLAAVFPCMSAFSDAAAEPTPMPSDRTVSTGTEGLANATRDRAGLIRPRDDRPAFSLEVGGRWESAVHPSAIDD